MIGKWPQGKRERKKGGEYESLTGVGPTVSAE